MDNVLENVIPAAPSETSATLAVPPVAQVAVPAAAPASPAADEKPDVVDDVLIETVSIDGMCGVY